MNEYNIQYETFTKGGVEFELQGVRGDWGLHVVHPKTFHPEWDGYLDHYPTKADAKWFAGEFLKNNKPNHGYAALVQTTG